MKINIRRHAVFVFCAALAAPSVSLVAQDDNSVPRLWLDLQAALPRKATGKGKDFMRANSSAAAPVDWGATTEAVGVVLGRSQGSAVEPYAMYYLANFLFNAGQTDEAQALFQGLQEQFPEHPLVKAKLTESGRSHVTAAIDDCRRETEWLKRFPRPQSKKPELSADRRVTFSFPKGDVVFAFFDNVAPKTVEQFVKHVKEGLYNGTIVGRVQADISIQLGFKESEKGRIVQSDVSKGTPPPIPFELSRAVHKRGSLSMMRNLGQPESHGVLFEVLLREQPDQDFTRTVFGEVVSGIEIIEDISRQPRDQFEYPAATVGVKAARVAK